MSHETPPQWDRSMRQRLHHGEVAALSELYDRFAPLTYGIASRILEDDTLAADVTREVFGRLWENPEAFDPTAVPMRSWIAGEAHRLGVQLLREHGGPGSAEQRSQRVRSASTAARADYIVSSMPAPLREALELAHARRQDYGAVAEQLGISEAEARRRLRLGLQLLATAASYAAPPSAPAPSTPPAGPPPGGATGADPPTIHRPPEQR